MKIFSNFDTTLYTSTHPSSDEMAGFLESLAIPQLTLEHQILADSPIELSAVKTDIYKLKLNKSAESNGFSAELYEKFKNILVIKLHKVFQTF